jgi:hypothetical protein
MAVTINASTIAGLVQTADTSGVLALQTAGTTAVTISSGQVATFAQAPVLPAASIPQAALAAGVAGNGPAFSAYQSTAQSLTANTITKLQLQTEEFDTAGAFDNATNYRFQPTVAGYYQVNGSYTALANRTYNVVYIYKTGIIFKTSNTANNLTGSGASISALVYLNGSSDYVELYALTGITQSVTNNAQDTYFQAVMVRSA